ncbi:MAG: hypothetical protein HYR70_04395 [Chloroflexi bacterium]|nr:hypothetical protein [Chloroflexota bacterium]MBI3340796.1 hypothetical protein [Chloroflexota bacterium]
MNHADHANITGEGLQSLQNDPSVQDAEGRIVADIKNDPRYGNKAFSIPSDYAGHKTEDGFDGNFTANGPSRNYAIGLLTQNPAFLMVHSATLYATNTTVSADGKISTTWKVKDQFDYLPDWNNHQRSHYWEYNIGATLSYPIYYGWLNAKSQVPITAEWNNPCNRCR